MARSMRTCLHSGRLALLAILVSGGIVLQILVSIQVYYLHTNLLLFFLIFSDHCLNPVTVSSSGLCSV